MKLKKLLWIFSLGILMFLLSLSLEAASKETGNTSSKIYIGDNPAHFTFMLNGKSDEGTAEGVRDSVGTGLWKVGSSSECSRPYGTVGSEDPKVIAMLEKEINFSQSIYADPATRLKRNFIKATHLLKGNGTLGKERMTLDIRIEDRQGNITAQAKVSGPKKDFLQLIDEAAISLGKQMCQPKPKPPSKTSCPHLWSVTFEQGGTINSNSCFGSGLSGSDAISTVKGYAHFPKVLIWPNDLYMPSFSEERKCDKYERKNIRDYNVKSHGETYQLIDGHDGIEADRVFLRASNMHDEKRLWIRGYGSIPLSAVESKIRSTDSAQGNTSFNIKGRCGVKFSFTPLY